MQNALFLTCGIGAVAASAYAAMMALKMNQYIEKNYRLFSLSSLISASREKSEVFGKYKRNELDDPQLEKYVRRFLYARNICLGLTLCAFFVLVVPGLVEL